jgi:hypothetical protein
MGDSGRQAAMICVIPVSDSAIGFSTMTFLFETRR